MTSNDILNKRFERATVGGYRADDVNAFMVALADSISDKSKTTNKEIDTLNKDKKNLQNKLVVLANKLEEYRSDEDSMRTALVGAQKLGDTIVKESKEKSESLLESAVAEAERIIAKANEDAKKISVNAKAKYESELLALERTKREVSQFKKKVLTMYKQQIDLIEILPESDNIPSIPPPLTTNIPKKTPEPTENDHKNSSKNMAGVEEDISKLENSENLLKSELKPDKNFEPLQFGAGFRLANDD